jgi:hypothetical protein
MIRNTMQTVAEAKRAVYGGASASASHSRSG